MCRRGNNISMLTGLVLCLILFLSCEGLPGIQKKIELYEIIPVDKAIKIGKLENGLTYYIRQNKNPDNRA